MDRNMEYKLAFLSDVKRDYLVMQQMADSIDAALSRLHRSADYMENARDDMRDDVALTNLEQETIYMQGYMDCIVQILGERTINTIMQFTR